MADHPQGGDSGPSRGAQWAATALLVAALFIPQVVQGLYGGVARELPEAFSVLCGACLVLSLTTWFSLYSQRHQVPWVMDMGWFLFSAWVIVIPYYILKREGRAGFARIALFCCTGLAARAAGWAVLIWMRVLVRGE